MRFIIIILTLVFSITGCVTIDTALKIKTSGSGSTFKVEIPSDVNIKQLKIKVDSTEAIRTALVIKYGDSYQRYLDYLKGLHIDSKENTLQNSEITVAAHDSYNGSVSERIFEHILEKYKPIGFSNSATYNRLIKDEKVIFGHSRVMFKDFDVLLVIGINSNCDGKPQFDVLKAYGNIVCENKVKFTFAYPMVNKDKVRKVFVNTKESTSAEGISKRSALFRYIRKRNQATKLILVQGDQIFSKEQNNTYTMRQGDLLKILKERAFQLMSEEKQADSTADTLIKQAICRSAFMTLDKISKLYPSGGKVSAVAGNDITVEGLDNIGFMNGQDAVIFESNGAQDVPLALASVTNVSYLPGLIHADLRVYKYSNEAAEDRLKAYEVGSVEGTELYALGLGVTKEFVNEGGLCKVE